MEEINIDKVIADEFNPIKEVQSAIYKKYPQQNIQMMQIVLLLWSSYPICKQRRFLIQQSRPWKYLPLTIPMKCLFALLVPRAVRVAQK